MRPADSSNLNSFFVQIFHFEATEEFLEYISDGALSIEIWGNRSKGFGQTSNWTPSIESVATNSEDG